MSERLRITFRYRRGDQVRYGSPGAVPVLTVYQQRYTVRDVLAPCCDYLVGAPGHEAFWANEADLIAVREPTR